MNIKNKNLLYIFPIFFAVLTFIITMLRTPFWDETHAFEIARLNPFQILYLTRIEGHTALWYFILKPFSSIKLYPYSMYIINWIFCTSAVFVLWKKSPFNSWIKFLITFSTPFIFYFGTVARCYGIGILLLFLICSEFKNRYKKSKLYSILLFVCSNTSLLMFIPCFYLWLMFLYQLFKKKSDNFKFALYMFITNLLLIFVQFFRFSFPDIKRQDGNIFLQLTVNFFNIIHEYTNIFVFSFKITIHLLIIFGIIHLFKKSKYALWFFLSANITLSALFLFIYSGSIWNHFFYYVYFIALCWIFHRQIFSNKVIKCLSAVVCTFMMFSFMIFGEKIFIFTYTSKSDLVADFIAKNTEKNSKLYCLDWWSDISPSSDIYLLKKGIELYDVFGYKRTSFASLKNIFTYRVLVIDIGSFYESLDKTKKNYIVTDGTMLENFKNASNNDKYYLKPIKIDEKLDVGIFELVKNL